MRSTTPLVLAALVQASSCSSQPSSECICDANVSPVCGSDGVTYGNACEAACHHVDVRHAGFCALDGGGCNCNKNLAPVCGVDGKTYDNSCLANCAGIAVAWSGTCRKEAGVVEGTTGRKCSADSDCRFYPNAGCCGVCSNLTDPVPPPIPCGAACSDPPPSCLCEKGVCSSGDLAQNAWCNVTRDRCGPGLKCCTCTSCAMCPCPNPPDAACVFPIGGKCP